MDLCGVQARSNTVLPLDSLSLSLLIPILQCKLLLSKCSSIEQTDWIALRDSEVSVNNMWPRLFHIHILVSGVLKHGLSADVVP